ncbi:lysoplasmalogenase [Paenibacillus urinalis]|uniref:Lysoplasmalogenase n=1 Tax=Paenibacillus urinalis TaxID=521520 RepID=A0ABY7XBZ2_9BACL|nr:lysoplasmalogenase [Paenibacillus urinalis]WDH99470.1 lysoplasmalogenase [Paenibacillus urinalis]WDI03103.1 lysoplasmalogenase [Paenibacillus urinalis]
MMYFGRNLLLPLLVLITSILYIFFIPEEPFEVKLLFKLIPMALIILYALLRMRTGRRSAHALLLAGLFFCMLGDGLLPIWFVYGLLAFLIGHLFYLTAFLNQWRFSWIRLLSIIPIGIYAWIMGGKLAQHIAMSADLKGLIIPVIAYVTVISLMLWSAVMTGNVWASIGSLLFVISDSILAWNKFVEAIPYAGVLIMATYYAAQFLIACSIGAAAHRRSSLLKVNIKY